jgi:hypothetical protein
VYDKAFVEIKQDKVLCSGYNVKQKKNGIVLMLFWSISHPYLDYLTLGDRLSGDICSNSTITQKGGGLIKVVDLIITLTYRNERRTNSDVPCYKTKSNK